MAGRLVRASIRVCAGALVCFFAAIGLFVLPAPVVLLWASLGLATAGFVRTCANVAGEEQRPSWWRAGAMGLGTVGSCLALAGLTMVLGSATLPVVLLLLFGGAVWWWQRHRTWGPASGTSVVDAKELDQGEAGLLATVSTVTPSPSAHVPAVRPTDMTIRELCAVWQQSYWLLCEHPPGSARDELISLRESVLDELGRRDPEGISRWLESLPRAGASPVRFLTMFGHDNRGPTTGNV